MEEGPAQAQQQVKEEYCGGSGLLCWVVKRAKTPFRARLWELKWSEGLFCARMEGDGGVFWARIVVSQEKAASGIFRDLQGWASWAGPLAGLGWRGRPSIVYTVLLPVQQVTL